MRTNTPLVLTVELQSGLSLLLGQTRKGGLRDTGIYPCDGTPPSLGGSQFRLLKRNSAISQVMERSCLEHGMAQRGPSALVGRHYVKLPLQAVSVHCTPP